jgi:hypothetical protein
MAPSSAKKRNQNHKQQPQAWPPVESTIYFPAKIIGVKVDPISGRHSATDLFFLPFLFSFLKPDAYQPGKQVPFLPTDSTALPDQGLGSTIQGNNAKRWAQTTVPTLHGQLARRNRQPSRNTIPSVRNHKQNPAMAWPAVGWAGAFSAHQFDSIPAQGLGSTLQGKNATRWAQTTVPTLRRQPARENGPITGHPSEKAPS